MIRKLSLALAIAMGSVPVAVNALGMGEIHLKSALNEYLDADIDLLSVSAEELSDIRVTLAPASAYQRAGIERPFHLTKLRFRADAAVDGSPIIHVSSRDPIREPFLNFLVEINWPKGKLVREYTVLLDPPVTLGRRPAPIQEPTRAASTSRASASSSTSSVTPAGAMAGMDEYGPTQKNDTLWKIASKVRHEGTNMNQTMLALQRANPNAFIKNNINNLKRGQILRIPKKEEVLEISRQQARESYRDQLSEWQGARAPGMASPVEKTAGEMASADPASETTPKAELKIASPRPGGEGAGGAGDGTGEAEVKVQKQALVAAEEALESARQEGDELNSRVDDLESQLTDLQRLLELKNDQLAQFQATLAEQDSVKTEVQSEMTAETDEMASTATDAAIEVQETDAAEEVVVEDDTSSMPDEVQLTTPEPETMVVEESSVAAITEPVVEEVAATEAPVVEDEIPAPATKMEPQQSGPLETIKGLLETIKGDTTLMGGVLGALVLLLGLLWAMIRRRRKGEEDFQESILVSTIDDSDPEQTDNLSQNSVSQITDETSFLSDFSPSDIDALQDETGEVDPLAEADVYIAYGRYQQAEELIRQAIDRDPERDGLKHKLFEILFAIKNADGFTEFAESCVQQDIHNKDADAWEKVLEMGAQLAPEHTLFSNADTPTAASLQGDDNVVDLNSDFGLDEGLDLDEISSSVDFLDAETEAELGAVELSGLHDLIDESGKKSEPEDDGLDFDLDLGLDSEMDLDEELRDLSEQDGTAEDETFDLPEPDETDEETSPEFGFELDETSDEIEDNDLATDDETLELPVAEASDDEISMELPGAVQEATEDDDINVSHDLTDIDVDDDLTDLDVGDAVEDLGLQDSMDGESVFAIDDPLESSEFEEADLQESIEQATSELTDLEQSEPEEEVESNLEDELDLEGLDLESDSAIVGIDELVDTTDSEMLSLDDINEDQPAATEAGDSASDADAMDDEVNTKLDLARAYVEMEDHDGAKSILEEVIGEGSEGQKLEAQRLLDELS